ncbi:hypothetical protein JG688_00014156, partial [Phytophthora aleatoria]
MSRRRWHQGINIIDKAKKWISELDLRWMFRLLTELKIIRRQIVRKKIAICNGKRTQLTLSLFDEHMHVVDFAGRYQLSDTALMEAMSTMFGLRPDVFIVDPLIWGVVERGMTTAPGEKIERLFTGVSDHKILIPVNCSGPQWCAIRLNLERNEITNYDSMRLSNALTLRSLAHQLVPHLPQTEDRYRVDAYVSEMGRNWTATIAEAMSCPRSTCIAVRKLLGDYVRRHCNTCATAFCRC